MRKLIAVAAASATFGAMISALVTTAVQSEADARAVAAAVQQVNDEGVDRLLIELQTELTPVENLRDVGPDFQQLGAQLARELHAIAQNTAR
jgi:hypothetical protein